MSNVWTLMFAFCIVFVVTEGRYIPTRTYRVQNGPLVHSNRRISNPTNTQLYRNLLQRHSNQIRRNPISLRATRISNASSRRYLQAPQRHSPFDSIVKQASRRVSEARDFHLKDSKDTARTNTVVKNPTSKKRFNINLQFNELNSVNDKDNLSRRKITINANNFRKLRISHKDSNIVINRIASHGKEQNSLSPFSQDHTVRSDKPQTSILQKSKVAKRGRASRTFKRSKNNGISSVMKLNKKFDSVTLPYAAWYMVTSKPKSNTSTSSSKPTTNSSASSTGKRPVSVSFTSHKTTLPSAPVTPTTLPVIEAIEDIDLPDLPDTAELPDTKSDSAGDSKHD